MLEDGVELERLGLELRGQRLVQVGLRRAGDLLEDVEHSVNLLLVEHAKHALLELDVPLGDLAQRLDPILDRLVELGVELGVERHEHEDVAGLCALLAVL